MNNYQNTKTELLLQERNRIVELYLNWDGMTSFENIPGSYNPLAIELSDIGIGELRDKYKVTCKQEDVLRILKSLKIGLTDFDDIYWWTCIILDKGYIQCETPETYQVIFDLNCRGGEVDNSTLKDYIKRLS